MVHSCTHGFSLSFCRKEWPLPFNALDGLVVWKLVTVDQTFIRLAAQLDAFKGFNFINCVNFQQTNWIVLQLLRHSHS